MSDDFERERVRGERPDRFRDGGPRRNRRDESRDLPPPSSGGAGKVIVIIFAVLALFGFCVLGGCGLAGFLLYREAEKSSERYYVSNNYREIGVAMHDYESSNGTFPPASMKTRDGKPGLSWRVALLPYIGQTNLYTKFLTNEAWDHPTNLALAFQMPKVYAPTRSVAGDRTHMRLFIGPQAIYDPKERQPKSVGAILDGSSNTFLVVESTESVQWIKPDELKYDPVGSVPSLGLPEKNYFQVLFADGSSMRLKKSMSPQQIKAGITASGGEVVTFDYDN